MKKTDRSFASLIFIRLRRTVFPSLALARRSALPRKHRPGFFPAKTKTGGPLCFYFSLQKESRMFWTH